MVCRLSVSTANQWTANHPSKGRGQVAWTILILFGTNHISGTAETSLVIFCTQVGYVKLQHMDDKSPQMGRCHVPWLIFSFDASNHIMNDARRYAVWPDPRSRSRALQSWKSGHFQKLSHPPFTMEAGNWPQILKPGHNIYVWSSRIIVSRDFEVGRNVSCEESTVSPVRG